MLCFEIGGGGLKTIQDLTSTTDFSHKVCGPVIGWGLIITSVHDNVTAHMDPEYTLIPARGPGASTVNVRKSQQQKRCSVINLAAVMATVLINCVIK